MLVKRISQYTVTEITFGDTDYRRNAAEGWEQRYGESWEPCYGRETPLEEAFQAMVRAGTVRDH